MVTRRCAHCDDRAWCHAHYWHRDWAERLRGAGFEVPDCPIYNPGGNQPFHLRPAVSRLVSVIQSLTLRGLGESIAVAGAVRAAAGGEDGVVTAYAIGGDEALCDLAETAWRAYSAARQPVWEAP